MQECLPPPFIYSNWIDCSLSRNGVARQVAGRLQCLTCSFCNLFRNFFWACNDCKEITGVTQSRFFCLLSDNIGNINTLQVAEDMLCSQITCCNLQSIPKTFCVIVAEITAELYFVQLLQASKCRKASCKEGMLHTALYLHRVTLAVGLDSTSCNDCLQPKTGTCNVSPATCIEFFPIFARQAAREIASCNTCFTHKIYGIL